MVTLAAGSGSVEEFFADVPLGRHVYDVLVDVVDALATAAEEGPVSVRVSTSQVAFRRRVGFCWLWLPGRYLRRPAADVVLSVALARQDSSPRWKQVVQVGERRWMHHLELRSVAGVDAQVAGFVGEAFLLAG